MVQQRQGNLLKILLQGGFERTTLPTKQAVLCMRSMMCRSVEDLVEAVNTNTRYGSSCNFAKYSSQLSVMMGKHEVYQV